MNPHHQTEPRSSSLPAKTHQPPISETMALSELRSVNDKEPMKNKNVVLQSVMIRESNIHCVSQPSSIDFKEGNAKIIDSNSSTGVEESNGKENRYCGNKNLLGSQSNASGLTSVRELNFRVSEGEKPYPCNVCDEQFKSRSQRIRHECPFLFQTPHICIVCGVRFIIKSDLEEHVKRHKAAGSYSCVCCDEVFEYPKDLNSHMRSTHICRNRFICSVCGQAFYQKGHLEYHLARHEVTRGHKCFVCKKTFLSISELEKHAEVHASKYSHKCCQCGEAFTSSHELQAHNFTEKIPYRCALCGEEFFYLNSLHNHTADEMKCLLCGHGFGGKFALKKHSKLCHLLFFPKYGESTNTNVHIDYPLEKKPTVYKVEDGSKTNTDDGSIDAGALNEQTISHKEEDAFKGTVGGKELRQAPTLKNQASGHRRERFKCKVCRARFKMYSEVCYHKRLYKCVTCAQEINCRTEMMKHKALIIKNSCPLCKRPFCKEKDLEKHRSSLPCSVCGKLFCTKYQRKVHEKQHIDTVKLAHICFLCGKGFESMSALKQHDIYHHRRGQYACTICEKLYVSQQELKCHSCTYTTSRKVKNHHSVRCFLCGLQILQLHVKPHINKHHTCHKTEKCNLCGQRFTTEDELDMHRMRCFSRYKTLNLHHEQQKDVNVHAGKTYVCPVCEEGFVSQSDLQKHHFTEKDKMPYQCEECGETFWLLKELTEHNATHHGDGIPSKKAHIDPMIRRIRLT